MTSAASKISVYSLSDLKNTSDDALPNYLTSLKFKQSHLLTDVRLALGYIAVTIAAATFYYDYKFGWEKSKDYTLWAVIVYFVLNSALTGWIWLVERGKVFEGKKDGILLSISSSVPKHRPVYKLEVAANTKGQTSSVSTTHIEAPFCRWYTSDGHFMAKPFQQWLSSEIPVIKAASVSLPARAESKS